MTRTEDPFPRMAHQQRPDYGIDCFAVTTSR